ncbi:MAG: cupin domain-containing protein [Gammaproteobacteria bacterium]|nr:cupin domain-containing protein [Gammaproteobacteria bacterium]
MGDRTKPEVWTRERCFVTELVNGPEWPEFSLARCRVEPGITTELHVLSVHEIYVIERGQGLMQVGDGAPFEVAPGSTVTIPQQTPQCITNTGDDDLVFLCVCAPRFLKEHYTSVE